MSYEKEGVTMDAVWLVPEEPEEFAADPQAASGEPLAADAAAQEDRPIARKPALAAMGDDDDFWEIPTRLAP
jgi:hypothetical protein